ncbi:hypothetical protein N2152v2_010637 [Parachlorella kessleri]
MLSLLEQYPHREPPQHNRQLRLSPLWKNQLDRLPSNPRAVAVLQLIRIEEEGAFIGLVGGSPGGPKEKQLLTGSKPQEEVELLPGRSWRAKLSDRDARLVTELVAGVTRWRRRLDFVICHLTKSADVSELDAPLRQALRVGLYEMLELKAPSHTVNEHVALIKRVMNPGAGGFANGVLRSAVRLIESHQLPQPPAPPAQADIRAVADALGVATSHPTWLVERWLRQLGRQQTLALLRWNNVRPTHSLRVSPALGCTPSQLSAKLLGQGIAATPSTFLPQEFVRVESGLQALLATGMLAQGHVQVQDEAAGLVVAMLDPQPGHTLLDACAAPGGKTLYAAARMGGRGSILALDISAPRLQALAAMAARQGFSDIVATHAADFTQLAAGPQQPRGQQRQRQRPGVLVGAATASAAPPAGALGMSSAGTQLVVPRRSLPWQPLQPGDRVGSSGSGNVPMLDTELNDSSSSSSQPASLQQSNTATDTPTGLSAAQPSPSGTAESLLQSQFDRVLLDAPCSGTGVLAKRADLRWRRHPGDVQQLCRLQAAAAWVKPGGVLVYSTCSIEPEENQAQIAGFLAKHPDFVPEQPPPSAGISPECLTPEGFLCMLPHVHGTDGAFAARLRRRPATPSMTRRA